MRYCDLGDLREYLKLSSGETGDNGLLETLIVAAEDWVDWYKRARFDAETATKYFDYQSAWSLDLGEEIVSVTSVTNGDDTALTETTHYYLYPLNGPPYRWIQIRQDVGQGFVYSGTPQRAITVVGEWGRYARVPPRIKMATTRLAAYYYRQKDANIFDVTAFPGSGEMVIPQGIPKDVIKILGSRGILL